MGYYRLLAFLICISCQYFHASKKDLTVVGQAYFADSLPRLSIMLIQLCLEEGLSVNFVNTRKRIHDTDMPVSVKRVVTKQAQKPGSVGILTDMLWTQWECPAYAMPACTIKFAYSMLESDQIPQEWVLLLNKQFDGVIVPDSYYKEVYERCGVRIPIFVLPCPLYLQDFLAAPRKTKVGNPFVFGISAAFNPRKNIELLVRAFAVEFKNNPAVQLVIHGRAGTEYGSVMNCIKELGLHNCQVIQGCLTHEEYLRFLTSLDCYVLLSKGEGFSITPREALALGIPCIITNNTAHKTICDTGGVYVVPAEQEEAAYYTDFKRVLGSRWGCTLEDARRALRAVYTEYDLYVERARSVDEWVTQYDYRSLKQAYKTLIKPNRVCMGAENCITDDGLMTNSVSLYSKYQSVVAGK